MRLHVVLSCSRTLDLIAPNVLQRSKAELRFDLGQFKHTHLCYLAYMGNVHAVIVVLGTGEMQCRPFQ